MARLYYEWRLVFRRVGRSSFVKYFYDLRDLEACKAEYEKHGYHITVEQREVTQWQEIRNFEI